MDHIQPDSPLHTFFGKLVFDACVRKINFTAERFLTLEIEERAIIVKLLLMEIQFLINIIESVTPERATIPPSLPISTTTRRFLFGRQVSKFRKPEKQPPQIPEEQEVLLDLRIGKNAPDTTTKFNTPQNFNH